MKRFLIWIPTYEGKLSTDLIMWLDNFKVPEWWAYSKAYVSRTPIHMARNILIEKMLEWNFDYLIMFDDDQLPMSKDAFYRLLVADKDMVAGCVRYRKKSEYISICKKEKFEKAGAEWMRSYKPYKEIPSQWLFQVDNAGTGMCCISRKVCEFMHKTYNKEPFESKSTTYTKQVDGEWREVGYNTAEPEPKDWKIQLVRRVLSEDYLFFERAISHWFELWADWQAKAYHFWDPIRLEP